MADVKFAAYSYHTDNLGDDVQTLAATQYLPRVDFYVNRDWLGLPRGRRFGPPVCLIANGWYMHNPAELYLGRMSRNLGLRAASNPHVRRGQRLVHMRVPHAWPPSRNVEALLISMHVADQAAEAMLSAPSLEYMRSKGPVGCRDMATLRRLREAGLDDAWFSGCLTLTLKRPEVARGEEIVFVDVPGIDGPGAAELACLPPEAGKRLRFLTHATRLFDGRKRRRMARELLRRYAAAQLVVTSRLHCALPCLALGTPVLFVPDAPDDPRFHGILPFVRHCRRPELGQRLAALDWTNPPSNPRDILPLAAPLGRWCEDHVRRFAT